MSSRQTTCTKCESKPANASDLNRLPCKRLLCIECLSYESINNNYQYSCICGSKHKLKKYELIVKNHETSSKRKREEIEEMAHVKLKKICRGLAELKEKEENREEIVRSHCEFIKSEIEINVESIMIELNKAREEILGNIDVFENECIQNLTSTSTTHTSTATAIVSNTKSILTKEIASTAQQMVDKYTNRRPID